MLRVAARVLTAALVAASLHAAPPLPSPESVLGLRVGEDRKLADWNQIVGYFHALDAATDRIRVEEVGKTTQGRPFLIATITAEANMARLEEIRRANLRLADPRGLSDDEARRLVAGGKVVVAHNHGIHSTEVAAPQASMELAYELASSQDPRVLQILDATVILMIPSHNPDGTQMVVDWYRRSLGTPWEGGEIPFLYHPYAGHDNNRDWYMFTQVESRLTAEHLYDRWRPQIVHDLHQMGARGPRIFVPPYVDPWEPNVDPAIIAASSALGTHVAARLISEGKQGVVVGAIYDGWTPARAYAHTHGGVRLLTECASARMATPIEIKAEELDRGIGYDAKAASWNFPLPWPGGTWRLRDIVDYQLSASRAILEHAAAHREFWLSNFLAVNRRAATRTSPFAFVVSSEQKDPLATARLLSVLRLGGVEVHRARVAFDAAGRRFPPGSHVVLLAQPWSALAKSLLERQRYPDIREQPGGPPRRPYDVTAHTLPLLLGVDVATIDVPFEASLQPVDVVGVTPGRIEGKGRYYAIGHKTADLVALSRLLKDGVAVRWATSAFDGGGRRFPSGTLLVPAQALAKLQPLVHDFGVVAYGVRSTGPSLALRKPRVGLYQSWVPSMDEGWTRFVFEKEMGVEYTTLHDADVAAGGLEMRFDVLVIPDQPARAILNGFAPGTMPEPYTGGLSSTGIARLKAFVEAGGTLVTLNQASELALQELKIDVRNALARAAPREGAREGGVQGPGAILAVKADLTHPLAHGMDEESMVWFEASPAFDPGSARAVLTYADENPLLSGWLSGGGRLRAKAALVEAPLGKGRVVLFGFRPQYRAQSWATYVPFLNALYLAAAKPVP